MQLIPTYHNRDDMFRKISYKFLYYGGYEHSLPTVHQPLQKYDLRPWTWDIPRRNYIRISR